MSGLKCVQGLMVNAHGMITGIRVEWTFDETYAAFALEGLDTNGDGSYGPDEINDGDR